MTDLPDGTTDARRDAVFVEEYAATGDVLVALRRAGIGHVMYPMEVIGRLMLGRDDILLAVAVARKALMRSRSVAVEVTQASLIADMQAVFEDAMTFSDRKAAIAAKKVQAEVAGLLSKQLTVTHKTAVEMDTATLLRIASGGGPAMIEGNAVEVEDVEFLT